MTAEAYRKNIEELISEIEDTKLLRCIWLFIIGATGEKKNSTTCTPEAMQ